MGQWGATTAKLKPTTLGYTENYTKKHQFSKKKHHKHQQTITNCFCYLPMMVGTKQGSVMTEKQYQLV